MITDLEIILGKIESLIEDTRTVELLGYLYSAQSEIDRAITCARRIQEQGRAP